jgi:hypothetical protein
VEVRLTVEKDGQAVELWSDKTAKSAVLPQVVDEMRDEAATLVQRMINERRKVLDERRKALGTR